MKKLWLWSFSLFLVATLFGCSGGGGGGSGGLTTNIFDGWLNVVPPENVALTGISQDADYNADPDSLPFSITDHGVSTDTDPTPTVRIRYNADGIIESIEVVTPHVALSWNEANGDTFDTFTDADGDPTWVIATDLAQSDIGILFNPLAMDPARAWEYQTFGAWATGGGISGAIGAISVGMPTPDDRIPESLIRDPVTFEGYSAGIYTNSEGTAAYTTMSDVSVELDFFNQKLIFGTNETKLFDLENGIEWLPGDGAPSLDMAGELSYDTGVNSFTGVVTAAGLSGESTGQFYGPGPDLEELGGVFSLSPADPESLSHEYYSGAYGAAAVPAP